VVNINTIQNKMKMKKNQVKKCSDQTQRKVKMEGSGKYSMWKRRIKTEDLEREICRGT
jgi:hypothetical protein